MIASTNAASSTLGGTPSQVVNKKAQLKTEDFIKMMITQLQNQDPMEPAKNDQLLAQMSQIGQLQSSQQLQDGLKTMVLQSQIGSAAGLIGKTVEGLNAADEPVSGVVRTVKVVDGKVNLEMQSGETLALDRVTEISPAAAAVGN